MKFHNYSISRMKKNPNQFSSNFGYNQLNNDYDLQNRIDRSLYPYHSMNLNSDLSQTSSNNNKPDYGYNINNYNLIEDFKATIRKTQQLTNDLLNKNNFYKSNYNKYNYNFNINTDSKTSSDEIDSENNYNSEESEENEEEEDNSINSENEINFKNQIKFKNQNENIIVQKNEGE